MSIGTFKAKTSEQCIGTFKTTAPIGQFRYVNPAEFEFVFSDKYGEYRSKVEKRAQHHFSDEAWGAYTELRLHKAVGKFSDFDDDLLQDKLSKLWDNFCNGPRFGIALVVEQSVLREDPWA